MYNLQPLFNPVQLTNVAAALYTSTSVRTRIDKLTVANTSLVTAYTITFHWVASGGAVSAANKIVNARTLLAGESWDVFPFIGHTLAAGDAIWALASTTLVVNCFGSGLVMS